MASEGQARAVGLRMMAVGLGQVAAAAAGEAAALGGYRPSPEDAQRVSRALSQAVIAMTALVEDWAAVTDEQLEGAAGDLGRQVLRAVLGEPPALN